MKKFMPPPARIMDLGVNNPFSDMMRNEGYLVDNTGGEDLDEDVTLAKATNYDVVTAFEILEHLVSPYTLLKSIEAPKLIISVPLQVWFSKPHRNPNDPWDNHYHEFYPFQMDWLVKKAGWNIQYAEKWTSPDRLRPGIRPILRFIWPSYYFLVCNKK